jgi:hypothetical protein
MKRLFLALCTLSTLAVAGCGDDETPIDPGPVDQGSNVDELSGTFDVTADIEKDTRWKSGAVVTLKKHVFVKAGATLYVEAGVTVKGDERTSLVITREGKLNAVGTAEAPIVFTSSKPVGSRKTGDWGGVVLLGKARTNAAGDATKGLNAGEEQIEGFNSTSGETKYGGSDDTHDCGTLKYARIEFAGFKLAEGNELNGLTTGSCGSKTVLDYIQVHLGQDDGIEMFGGTANLKHILITQPDDDGLDWDRGWRGKVQFLVLQHNANVGNFGFEGDNNANQKDAEPRTLPEIYNVTLVSSDRPVKGTAVQGVMHLKNGTAGKIHNLIAMGFAEGAVDVDGAPAVAQWSAGSLFIKSSLFWDIQNEPAGFEAEATDNDGGFDENAQIFNAGGTNALSNRYVDPQLAAPFDLDAPNFQPAAGSPALTGAATPPADGFFEPVSFIGAVGPGASWLAGWTAFPKS